MLIGSVIIVPVVLWLAGSCVGRQVLEEAAALCNNRVHEMATVLQRKVSAFCSSHRPPG